MIVTNADITGRLKLLADVHLKADSGDTTSFICTDLIDNADVSNNYVCFVSGDNVGEDRVISVFDKTTGAVTFTDALTSPITSTSEFCITKAGFQSDVLQAEQAIRNDLRNSGYDLDLFLNEPQLKEMYIYKTIELVCAGLMNDGQEHDAYYVNYERFKTLYGNERTALVADYDLNNDGNVDGEELQNVGQVMFTR